MKVIQGKLIGTGLRVGVIVSRFNEFISSKLLDGAMDCLTRHDVSETTIDVIWTPGAYEIPMVAKRIAACGKYDAVVCLGAVIRGESPHFDYVASEVSKGVAKVGMDSKIPVIFGVLTTDTTEQAIERAGTKSGNKGWQAALAAIEMANLYKNI